MILSKLDFYYNEYRRSVNVLIDLIMIFLLFYFAVVWFPLAMAAKVRLDEFQAAIQSLNSFLDMPAASMIIGSFFACILATFYLYLAIVKHVSTDFEVPITENDEMYQHKNIKWVL